METLDLEVLGYSLIRAYNQQLGFILKGNPNDGKSTFLKVIEALLRKHCSHLTLEQLSSRKSLTDLYNCTANIVDDTAQPTKLNIEQIQSIVTGGTIALPQKDGSEFTFKPCATLLFATTKILYFNNFNKSFTRRFKVIPFNANFDNTANKDMEDTILQFDNLSVLASMAIQAYSKVIADGHFHIPEFVEYDTKKYFFESNPAMEFVELFPISRLMIKGEYIAKYKQWCEHNGIAPLADNVFGKKVINLGYKPVDPTFDGIRNDYYAAEDFNVTKFREEYEKFISENPDTVSSILGYIDYLNKQNGL